MSMEVHIKARLQIVLTTLIKIDRDRHYPSLCMPAIIINVITSDGKWPLFPELIPGPVNNTPLLVLPHSEIADSQIDLNGHKI